MLKKTIFIGVAVSILAMEFQATAEAANGSVVVRDHRTKVIVRDHRTKVIVRDHRTKRPNEVVKIRKNPCYIGANKLKLLGYHHVKITHCQAPRYRYRAVKGNGIFAATMHPYSGRLKINMIGFAH